jgi:hypothetical protein
MEERLSYDVCVWYCGAWCFSKVFFAQKYIKIIFLHIVFLFLTSTHQNHQVTLKKTLI